MQSKRDRLIAAYEDWFINRSSGVNALTWAAVAELREQLPPPGPDEVEIEVQELFEEGPCPNR